MAGPARILVVEDNETNMMIFCDILTAAGHTVLAAASAEDAFQLARSGPLDLVLMDIQLPGLDGLEAVRRLKADPATAKVPVIALTAHAMSGHKEQAIQAGCEGYITKPIRSREFRDQVTEFLKSPRETR